MGEVAVFDPVAQLAGGAGANVAAEVGFGADQPAEADKFLGAHVVGFDDFAPVDVDAARALGARADAVLPVVIIGEAAAGPADDGGFDAAQGFDDVAAEAAGIGDGRILADPDAVVDAAAEVLGKMPVDVGVDGGDGVRRVEGDAGGGQGYLLFE